MNLDHKKVLKDLSEKETLGHYVVLWEDGGTNFIFGGNEMICLGMTTYAKAALIDYIAKRMPLVPAVNSSTIAPGGQA